MGWRRTTGPSVVGNSFWCCFGLCCSVLIVRTCVPEVVSRSGNSREGRGGSHFSVICCRGSTQFPVLDVVAVVQTVVQMEEFSAARQALEGASFTPGNLATLGDAHKTPIRRDHQCQEVL